MGMIETLNAIAIMRGEAEQVVKELHYAQLISLLQQGVLSPESKNNVL